MDFLFETLSKVSRLVQRLSVSGAREVRGTIMSGAASEAE